MKTTEIWKQTKYPFYEVSNQGRVRVLPRDVKHWRGGPRWIKGRLLPIEIRRGGYRTVRIQKNKGTSITCVHVLMLEAFVSPRPPKLLGLHWDDNPANNALSNLRWGTVKENSEDAKRNGKVARHLGEKNYFSKLTVAKVKGIRSEYARGVSTRALAAKHKVKRGTVWLVIKRRTWKHVA